MRAMLAAALACAIAAVPLDARADSCSVTSPGFSVFYNPMERAALFSVSSVTVACTSIRAPTPVHVGLSSGNSGTFSMRTLHSQSNASALAYNIYYNGTHSVFGDGTSTTANYANTLAPQNGSASDRFSLQLEAPPGQDLAPGLYSDSLLLEIDL